MTQAVAAALSVLASFVFVLGLALQQKGNLAAMRAQRAGTVHRSGRAELVATITRPVWILGILTGGVVGFAILALALRIGSLTIVEPFQVTQMIFTVPLSAWVVGTSVLRREWQAALVLVGGLACLVVMLAPASGAGSGDGSRWLLVVPVTVTFALVLAALALRYRDFASALLGASCGALFGLQGAAVKEVTALLGDGFTVAGFLGSWSPWVAGGVTLAAVVIQNLALRAGRLSAAQTTITTVGPAVSTAVGVFVFGEAVQTGPLRLLGAAVGVAACAWGVAHLARSPSILAAHEQPTATGA